MISATTHAEQLYKLAGQMVKHLRSYLADDDEVFNVLFPTNRQLVDAIYAQLQQHYFEQATSYEVKVTKGFRTIRSTKYPGCRGRTYDHSDSPSMSAATFAAWCLVASLSACIRSRNSTRILNGRFSVILENDPGVTKWFKPGRNDFNISYRSGVDEGEYEPDFVVETKMGKYLCEPKQKCYGRSGRHRQGRAATAWCANATQATGTFWKYLLVPHDAIDESKTFAGMAGTYEYQPLEAKGCPMTEPTVTCPNCRTEIKLTESLAAPLSGGDAPRLPTTARREGSNNFEREAAVKKRQEELQKAQASIDEQVAEKVKLERTTIAEEEARKAKQLLGADLNQKAKELADLQEILKQRDEKLAEAQKAQADVLKMQREIQDANESWTRQLRNGYRIRWLPFAPRPSWKQKRDSLSNSSKRNKPLVRCRSK